MQFTLNDEQRMLQDAVARLVERDYGFEQRRAYAREADGWSRALWAKAAKMGLFALAYPAEHGGLGGGPVELMIAMQVLGRALPLEPLLPAMALGPAALRGASDQQCARWIGPFAAGERTLAWAHAEPQSRYRLHDVVCRAHRDGATWVLDGDKSAVLHGDSADALLVTARVSGAARDRDGLALFLVDARAPGIARRSWRTQDGRRAADLRFEALRIDGAAAIGQPGEAASLIDAVVQAGIAALAAEAVGVMQTALGMTVEHLKTRQQFGAPIARFQALQHRCAEMLIAVEQSRSMAMFAALMLAEPDAAARATALSAVKVQIGQAARLVGQQAVQLHGAIGVTEEYPIGHCLKRLTVLETEFGDSDHHLALFARRGGFGAHAA
ncbi:MAG TPA: acyl-CoA dehydrogenase [Burkholderiaceae bacterium]|jgi:alkylation response protein AidB-like acyl-CoA dehydrogenase|nr:acyl-CoA dehydrogenase [Burkholderiaceae bacterium]